MERIPYRGLSLLALWCIVVGMFFIWAELSRMTLTMERVEHSTGRMFK